MTLPDLYLRLVRKHVEAALRAEGLYDEAVGTPYRAWADRITLRIRCPGPSGPVCILGIRVPYQQGSREWWAEGPRPTLIYEGRDVEAALQAVEEYLSDRGTVKYGF